MEVRLRGTSYFWRRALKPRAGGVEPVAEAPRVLLVGVWGLPSNWLKASYRPVLPPNRGSLSGAERGDSWVEADLAVESHSTVIAEASALEGWGFQVSLLVFAADSLASPGGIDRTGCQSASEVFEEVKASSTTSLPEDYDAIVERAERLAGAYLDCFLDEVFRERRPEARLEIVPSSASYRVHGGEGTVAYYYRGAPTTAQARMEHALLGALEYWRPDLIILDVSHGVNYFPLLAWRALSRVARVYAALREGSVYYAVVNSDPVNKEGEEARMNIIDSGRVEAKPLEALEEYHAGANNVRVYRSLVRQPPPLQAKNLDAAANAFIKKYAPLFPALILSYHYGFPLYIAAKLGRIRAETVRSTRKKYELLLAEALGLGHNPYKPKILRGSDNGEVEVAWEYALKPEALDTLYTMILLERLLEELSKSTPAAGMEGGAVYYSLRDLKELAEKRLGISRVGKTLFNNEVDSIVKRVEEFEDKCGPLSEPKVYSTIIEELENGCGQSSGPVACIVDERNFYAHAGMERRTILVARRGNEILVAYRPECLNVVEKLLRKAV